MLLTPTQRLPRRWFDAVRVVCLPLAAPVAAGEERAVTLVEFEQQTPLLDLDVELFQTTALSALRRAGWKIDDDDADALTEVEGSLALVGSVTETRDPELPSQVCVDVSVALLERGPDAWKQRRESFERFEEDYAEEQFFAAARAAYWAAPEGSPVREIMADLIDKLEF